MMLLIKILVIVYIVAINCYAFSLMSIQKNQNNNINKKRKITDGKILLSGTLGGALGVYISTFILNYRRDSIFIMVLMPILFAINIFIVVSAFTSGFWLR